MVNPGSSASNSTNHTHNGNNDSGSILPQRHTVRFVIHGAIRQTFVRDSIVAISKLPFTLSGKANHE